MATSRESLLKQAARCVKDLTVTPHTGWVELSWLRPHGHLAVVITHTASTVDDGLLQLICMEEAAWWAKEHGNGCGCEDCCISRVDLRRVRFTQ